MNKTSLRRLNGELIPLFYHPFNCGDGSTRTTERSVELALAFQWLERVDGDVVEVGAVTPYYLDVRDQLTEKISLVIDPQDPIGEQDRQRFAISITILLVAMYYRFQL